MAKTATKSKKKAANETFDAATLFEEIEALEHELHRAYRHLGDHLEHRPVRTSNDPKQLPMRMNWLRHDLEGLDALVRSRLDRNQSRSPVDKFRAARRKLSRLTPAALSRDISTMSSSSEMTDPYGMDPKFLDRLEPIIEFLFQNYWRVEIEGLEHIPDDGSAVIVGNHAGLLPFDALMAMHAVQHYHPNERQVRFLIEDWFYHFPVLSVLINRLGMVRASADNGKRLLREGHLVGVFPEGIKGISKPFSKRYAVQRFGRGGVVRLCIQSGVKAIPMAIIGAEETYPLLGHSRVMARLTSLPYFPLTPMFPWLGPLGFVPLPSKWSIRFGEPVDFSQYDDDDADNDMLVGQLNEQLRARVQDGVMALLSHRRRAFV